MGRYRYYWFEYVRKVMMRYPDKLKTEDTVQSKIAEAAIGKAISITMRRADGAERVRLMSMVYFTSGKRLPLEIAAESLYISHRTAQRWQRDFIYLVAEKMGYL